MKQIISYEYNSIITKNFLLKFPDGSYDTNVYGMYYTILCDVILDKNLGPKAKRIRFQAEPLLWKENEIEAMWDKFHRLLPELVQQHLDQAKEVTMLPVKCYVDLSTL